MDDDDDYEVEWQLLECLVAEMIRMDDDDLDEDHVVNDNED